MRFYTNVAIEGSSVLCREVIDGIPSMRKIDWQPTIYVRGKPRDPGTKKFTSLYGADVYSMKPGTIRECKDFVEQYKDVDGFEIFGQLNYSLQFMNEYNSVGFDSSFLSIWAIDIETVVPLDENGKTYFPNPTNVDGEVVLITMTNMATGATFTFGSRGAYNGNDSHYTECANEKQLLNLFFQFWEQKRIDIITGWNICGFDIPYIINRAKRIGIEEQMKKLSPWGKVRCIEKTFMGKTEYQIYITGVSVLDYIDLYKKYMLVKQESYSLGHIAQEELGHTKVDLSEYGSFNNQILNHWNKFVHYNIVDTTLIKDLNDKLRLIELVLTVAYEANVNYEDTSSPVKTWDAIIANYCLSNNIIVPQQAHESVLPLDGAYVKDPIPGWYRDVSSIDATSLYPSCIMTNNISPETWVGNCGITIDDFLTGKIPEKSSNYVVTPIGAMYRKDKRGILPELIEHFMKLRKATKSEMLRLEQVYEDTKDKSLVGKIAALDSKQNAIKTLMNSLFGALAQKNFRFFKHDHAASITLTGQYALRSIENQIDGRLNKLFGLEGGKYLVYIDTDSCYFALDKILDKFKVPSDKRINAIEKLTKEKITPIVNEICQVCCDSMNSYENRLSFKLEVAANKAIWLGKKKYTLKVHSSEGVTYAKPKFKTKGLELVRSSTPRYVRDKLKLALDVIFDTDESNTQKFIAEVKEEFMKLPYQDVAFPRGANNLQEYSAHSTIYRSDASVPIQVRASLLYNHYLKDYDVDGKYPAIGEGEKIKFCYLKKPNRIHENIIGFPVDGEIPVEFGIIDKIDYDLQFEKTFLAAMQLILTAIGWNAEERATLDEFFS